MLLEGHNAEVLCLAKASLFRYRLIKHSFKRISNQTFYDTKSKNEAFILSIGADPSSWHSDNMEQGNRGETVHYGR